MHTLSRFVLLATVLLTVSCSSGPRTAGWSMLGERTVNHAVDRDEIRVGARDGTFRAIKLMVRRRAVTFREVRVHYANGGVENLELRRQIPAGGESRVLDLNGQNRVIEKVVFFYNTGPIVGRRAQVQLYGRR